MAKNESLSRAKNAKKDEFYTQYEDIQSELNHYEKHFQGKLSFVTAMIHLRAISANSSSGTLIILN